MKTLSEAELVKTLRKLSDAAKQRLWIASPYIGSISAVSQILGNDWKASSTKSVRLLTDFEECSQLSFDTLQAFFKAGQIKTLHGLHAKIYIIDDNAIIASANLTEAGFSKRYEMGVLLTGEEANDCIEQFDAWWKELGLAVSLENLSELKSICAPRGQSPDEKGKRLQKLWPLPPEGKEAANRSGLGKLSDYDYFVACYRNLAEIYSQCQRLRKDMPLYLEIDGLLDYLFHHGEQPSHRYAGINQPARKIRDLDKEVGKWAQGYKEWVAGGNDIGWRLDRANLIKSRLGPRAISSLDWDNLRAVMDCLNCMNSFGINKAKFLNPRNNSLSSIQDSFHALLHGENDIKERLVNCKKSLRFFGDSSVQELIGFYDPVHYPIRNGNSNAGLRFFGYDVTA